MVERKKNQRPDEDDPFEMAFGVGDSSEEDQFAHLLMGGNEETKESEFMKVGTCAP